MLGCVKIADMCQDAMKMLEYAIGERICQDVQWRDSKMSHENTRNAIMKPLKRWWYHGRERQVRLMDVLYCQNDGRMLHHEEWMPEYSNDDRLPNSEK